MLQKISGQSNVEKIWLSIISLNLYNFRYFANVEQTRHEKKMLRTQLKENGKLEALKRGKVLDECGKVIDPKSVQ